MRLHALHLIFQKECTYGWYAGDCLEACSGNCAENTTCNRFNGICSNGCKTSFGGEKCEKNIGKS